MSTYTIPALEAIKHLPLCGEKTGKYPTTIDTWPLMMYPANAELYHALGAKK